MKISAQYKFRIANLNITYINNMMTNTFKHILFFYRKRLNLFTYVCRVVSQDTIGPIERVTLERVNTPSWYGGDVIRVYFDIEAQGDDRVRVKVRELFVGYH